MMKSVYGDRSTAYIVVDLFCGKRVVQDVYVHEQYRRQGMATDLMNQVCQDADAAGETLVLAVYPDGTGMTANQLLHWYGTFGFYCDQPTRNPRHMTRRPMSDDESDAGPA
jgi:GNAT superfamily N-acetyltransferase